MTLDAHRIRDFEDHSKIAKPHRLPPSVFLSNLRILLGTMPYGLVIRQGGEEDIKARRTPLPVCRRRSGLHRQTHPRWPFRGPPLGGNS
jgi:hypothetical protein